MWNLMSCTVTVILAIALVIALYEVVVYFIIRHPAMLRKCSRKIQNTIGHLYATGERSIMQYQPGCGRHDAELGYTLNPGSFRFSGIEFDNIYRINRLGVRDDEVSLDRPDIIVAGDSYATGWGADQEHTFAKRLETQTGYRVLNMAVPSYGTVREMMMLRKVKTDCLRYLIIQYCDDDYDENRRYFLNNNTLHTMRAETFRRLVALHSRPQRYFFGKYVLLKLKKRIDEFSQKKNGVPVPPEVDATDLFINAVMSNKDILEHVTIIVFEMNGKNQVNGFTTALRRKIASRTYPGFIKNMIVLDMSQVLRDIHFYVLDDHLTNTGHAVVAGELLKVVRKSDASRDLHGSPHGPSQSPVSRGID